MTQRLELPIGLLISQSGSYEAVSRAIHAGAELAIGEINARPQQPVKLIPVTIDPAGSLAGYVEGARVLLRDHGLKHVVGCYTSSSRKEVLPLFEKADALLWYPSHYEGFETSENVVYSGAAPNQHIVPLTRHLLGQFGTRGWMVGSNYVWAWENNRILREAIAASGGAVLGERYFPVGETDLGDVVRQIVADCPDFVFTTLIGQSGFAFLKMLRAAAEAAGIDQPSDMPVASCSLSEAELPLLGDAASGHLSSSVYFSTIKSDENRQFTALWNERFGQMGQASADAESAYVAVHLLARAAECAGSTGFEAVREAVRDLTFDAPQGQVTVDGDNLHCWMRPRIGRSRSDGSFDILVEHPAALRPDPYLTWAHDARDGDSRDLRLIQ
ncbi:transporter substrate-binding domain-containing protein [Sedimentitalea todarodis]|uniref:Transporter substrate-binding domain-containing protein n=1 Tax=Sedimentitalea todarodis TaxID=1631240 RepID=A0ABU3VL96_9RHOB|nr:transporter substrate-binding domain-containing protein [Sedimentitalea todarodis]MDU9006941.1 transporter substrate-binding domain-containing protein [Sedimentitalea todarodis]